MQAASAALPVGEQEFGVRRPAFDVSRRMPHMAWVSARLARPGRGVRFLFLDGDLVSESSYGYDSCTPRM